MATNKPRLIVTLEPGLHDRVEKLAHKNGVSLSQAAHDLILEAAEDVEEWGLVKLARDRLQTLDEKKLIPHKKFWK